MNTRTFYLEPDNGRESFGNKCHVNQYTDKGETVSDLISYGTKVATYRHEKNSMEVFGYFSATTGTHINAFLQFYGFNKATKAQMQNWTSNKI